MCDKDFLMWAAIDTCRSETNALISRPYPMRNSMQDLNPSNSIAGLLPV